VRSAVDSTIILDIVLPDPTHAESSLRLLEARAAAGSLVICPVVYAEVAAAFSPTSEFDRVAREMGLGYDDFTPEACALAGALWQEYRLRGGPRTRIISDFLIGSHAQLRSEVLLTRDRGYYRRYFRNLRIECP
jgi:predicted nucleic acid-binding protein